MLIRFAAWRPDNALLNSPYASDIKNVLCAEASYLPFPQLRPFSQAVPAQPLGGITVRDNSGGVHIFVGTATKLYKLNTATLAWTDVSKPATTYAATADNRWRFKQYGNYVVAVNINNDPQVYQLNSSTTFDDLAGNPPRAKHIAVCGDFLCLMDDTTFYWSEVDDISVWSGGNAGSQSFPDGGIIQGATDTTNPVIFQKAAIRWAQFIPGSTEVFSFQKRHDQRGCASPYSICTRGEFTFFADVGAFYQINSDGSQILPIGFEKVDRTFFGDISGPALTTIFGEIDPFYPRVYFAVARGNSESTLFNGLLVYDWQIGEWTQIETSASIYFPLPSGTIGYTLEGLDAIGDLESLPYSLDSKVWQGGAPVMAAIDADFKLGFFQGGAAEATLVTQEMGDTAGGRQRLSQATPIVDVDNLWKITVSVGARFRRSDAFVWGAERVPSSNTGVVQVRSRAGYHKFKLRIEAEASWSHAQGIDVTATSAGLR